ncbi:hypothetical protein ACIRPX_24585 [Streptomyces sp. NPDC101225]|uniref:hypothetical protein n=1 Tax=Streptomyces sp. NPDC101225 TaxID=3366135 RepID=UPI0038006327
MGEWDGYDDGRHSGSGPEREPSEERGQAAWAAGQPGSVPPWASAETQAGRTPPPWASAETRTGGPAPSAWPPPPPPPPVPGPGPVPATTVPAPSVAPAPRRGARNVLLAFVAVAVLGAGAGAGAWYLTRDHSTGDGAGSGSSAGVTVTTTPSQSAPPTDTPSAGGTPSASTFSSPSSPPSIGYRRAQDPVGYAVDVPETWTRRQTQGKLAPVVYYDNAADGRQLQIFEVTEDTPYQSLTLAETDPGFGFAKQRGYQPLGRDRGDTWAELTYRYDDTHKGARQVIDHRFRAAGGTLYAIRSSGPADLDPELVREPLAAAVRSFCPTGAACA